MLQLAASFPCVDGKKQDSLKDSVFTISKKLLEICSGNKTKKERWDPMALSMQAARDNEEKEKKTMQASKDNKEKAKKRRRKVKN